MQPAQVTVAQLGYCLACSLLHGLQWCCGSVVQLETIPACVCKQFWWSWEHCQMLLLFATWYPDLYAEHAFASYWLSLDVTVERLAHLFCIGVSWVQIWAWRWAPRQTFCGFLSLPGKFLDSTSYYATTTSTFFPFHYHSVIWNYVVWVTGNMIT
jgi:hypothetical protein